MDQAIIGMGQVAPTDAVSLTRTLPILLKASATTENEFRHKGESSTALG